MPPLRLAFMGSPDFALPVLGALSAAGHDIAAVYTQPRRPAGRGKAVRLSPVQRCVERLGLKVRVPETLKTSEVQEAFAALNLDAAVVAAYGLILPPKILSAPRLGCLNVHASLLPRWRGAAPIERAIMAGDSATGITIMQMDAGLDTGAIVLRRSLAIETADTAGTLRDRLAALGAEALEEALGGRASGALIPEPQPQTGVSYAAKITKSEARLDWSRPAIELERRIRGLSPFPGAWFEAVHKGRPQRIKVLRAQCVAARGAPGEVVSEDLDIACGAGGLRLLTLQRAGGRPLAREEFLRGFPMPLGTRLGGC